MVQTIKKVLVELMFRKIIYLQYGIIVVISMAVFGYFMDHMQFNRWFDKKVEKVATPHNDKIKTIFYGEHSIENINTKGRFYKFTKGEVNNIPYIKDTCISIQLGYIDFAFNYRPYCKLVGITID